MSEQLQLEDEAISISLRRAWDRALRMLATRVNKLTFETHIRTLKALTMTEGDPQDPGVCVITLGVPSAFTREWVEKRHAGVIRSILEEILDREVRVRFALTPREAPQATPTLFDAPAGAPNPTEPGTTKRTDAEPDARGDVSLDLFADNDAPIQGIAARIAAADRRAAERTLASKKPATVEKPKTIDKPLVSDRPSERPASRRSPQADPPTLNPRYTFDAFVVGPNNRLAHGGAAAVAQAPGNVYNPLFLYGPPGLGKTHLMHAIGHAIAEVSGGERVAYISGETFTTQFIASLRERRTDEFRRRWRSVDVLLIDDIHFIASKEATKEEFFHTFNTLYQTGKQVVLSSDRAPKELRMMDERLRSRFECGLIADIAPPDLETRLAILHRKAEGERMRIPDDVLLYMARLVQSNIRTLEGALVKLIAYASLVNSPVTTQLAADILERYYISAGIGAESTDPDSAHGGAGRPTGAGRVPRGRITADLVQRVVAARFGLSQEQLTGKRRDREVAHARQIAMHLLRELTDASLPGIGQVFGGRDHSTVAHACEKIRTQIPLDDDLRNLVEDLAGELRGQADIR